MHIFIVSLCLKFDWFKKNTICSCGRKHCGTKIGYILWMWALGIVIAPRPYGPVPNCSLNPRNLPLSPQFHDCRSHFNASMCLSIGWRTGNSILGQLVKDNRYVLVVGKHTVFDHFGRVWIVLHHPNYWIMCLDWVEYMLCLQCMDFHILWTRQSSITEANWKYWHWHFCILLQFCMDLFLCINYLLAPITNTSVLVEAATMT